MDLPARFALAAAVVVGFAAAPRAARACVAPLGCSGAGVLVGPANTKTIVFRSVRSPEVVNPMIEVRDASGALVPTIATPDPAIARHIILRADALQPGDYNVKWGALCTTMPTDDSGDGAEVTVTVPPAATVPTTIGKLGVTAPRRDTHGISSCDPPALAKAFPMVSVTVSVDKDTALLNYKHVTAWQVTVDGKPLPDPGYPSFGSAGYGNEPGGVVTASCDPSVDTGVSPGKHKIGVRATIAGLPAPLSAETEVDLSCASDATSSGEDTAGCSIGGNSSTTLLGAIALVALLGARRRR